MGRGRRDKVLLTLDQRKKLEEISRNGHAPTKKILHAQVLLMCDEGETATRKWTDEEISSAINTHRNSVWRIRKRFLQEGMEPSLNRRARICPPNPPKMNGEQEAKLIALCCSTPPEGRSHWSLRLITKELKTRGIVTEISHETVRSHLKKTNYVLGKNNVSVFLKEI
jgi:hypothetical protein